MLLDYYGNDASRLIEKKLFLFDMDGTIYLENALFDGVKELFSRIREGGGRYLFLTNNSSKSVADYVKKLRGMGVDATEEDFYTSAQATAAILKREFGQGLIYAQGTRSFLEELRSAGINCTTEYTKDALAIVVGFDTELTGEKQRTTSKMLTENDVPYYATNPDWVCPVEFGYVPDCGSMCFGYEKATGKRPQFIGKPAPTMIETVMEKFGCTREETVLFGDRLYTDVASGLNAGIDSVLVLSGETKIESVEKDEVKPTFVLRHVTDILSHFPR